MDEWQRYRELQTYVGWTDADAARISATRRLVAGSFPAIVEDFYRELRSHEATSRVITGGDAQIERLKLTLLNWLQELFSGMYDEAYVSRRLKVGRRHVEIGLPQVYVTAAISRLRSGLLRATREQWRDSPQELDATAAALNKLLDLDLAVIGEAYESAFVARQRTIDRRALDDLLQREKELSSGLLAHAQAAVVILDRAGHIVRFNSYLTSLFRDRPLAALEETDWFELFVEPKLRTELRQAVCLSLPDDPPRKVSSELIVDEQRRHLHWSLTMLRDAAGQPFAILAIGHDVTDLIESQRRALQAERLAAIGQMATGLAHESRNALQRIGASAEMLEMELENQPRELEHVRRIQAATSHVHQLLEDVRSYAAPMVLDRSPLMISEVWREAWELLMTQRTAKQATLRELFLTEEPIVSADRFRLVQIFRNLLDNALAAAAVPAQIEIICDRNSIADQPALRIRLRDNGPGLTAEQRRRMFEPFYTTKPTGTGLGTSIALRFVEAHGGAITIGDSTEQGTEIVVQIPC